MITYMAKRAKNITGRENNIYKSTKIETKQRGQASCSIAKRRELEKYETGEAYESYFLQRFLSHVRNF